mmetsp:Transcript_11355/g.33683  ORF Transcript_11355/g.33683 Transcript_11355/m.33683 type:complete len:292 (+) Transcript_11355:131-1006(+)
MEPAGKREPSRWPASSRASTMMPSSCHIWPWLLKTKTASPILNSFIALRCLKSSSSSSSLASSGTGSTSSTGGASSSTCWMASCSSCSTSSFGGCLSWKSSIAMLYFSIVKRCASNLATFCTIGRRNSTLHSSLLVICALAAVLTYLPRTFSISGNFALAWPRATPECTPASASETCKNSHLVAQVSRPRAAPPCSEADRMPKVIRRRPKDMGWAPSTSLISSMPPDPPADSGSFSGSGPSRHQFHRPSGLATSVQASSPVKNNGYRGIAPCARSPPHACPATAGCWAQLA